MLKSATGHFYGPAVALPEGTAYVDIVLRLPNTDVRRSFRVTRSDFMMLDFYDLVRVCPCPVITGLWEVHEFWGGTGNCRYYWKRSDTNLRDSD
jgi:hypothetical protein